MSPLWMVPIELVIIAGGVIAALTIGRPTAPGRHRLPKYQVTDELAEIEKWLAALQQEK